MGGEGCVVVRTWKLIRVFLSLRKISAGAEDRKDFCKLSHSLGVHEILSNTDVCLRVRKVCMRRVAVGIKYVE